MDAQRLSHSVCGCYGRGCQVGCLILWPVHICCYTCCLTCCRPAVLVCCTPVITPVTALLCWCVAHLLLHLLPPCFVGVLHTCCYTCYRPAVLVCCTLSDCPHVLDSFRNCSVHVVTHYSGFRWCAFYVLSQLCPGPYACSVGVSTL